MVHCIDIGDILSLDGTSNRTLTSNNDIVPTFLKYSNALDFSTHSFFPLKLEIFSFLFKGRAKQANDSPFKSHMPFT